MLKTSRFDFVSIDMEHSCLSMETVGDLCHAALSVDLVPIVRPSANDAPYLSRPLDNGAMRLSLLAEPIRVANGEIAPPPRPGHGIVFDPAALARSEVTQDPADSKRPRT